MSATNENSLVQDKDRIDDLESSSKGEKLILMKGPASLVMKNALDVMFAKPGLITSEVVVESQALDSYMAAAHAHRNAADGSAVGSHGPVISVYALNAEQLTPRVLVDAVNSLYGNWGKGEVVYVVDATNLERGQTTEQFKQLHVALESALSDKGVTLYRSLGEFVRHL